MLQLTIWDLSLLFSSFTPSLSLDFGNSRSRIPSPRIVMQGLQASAEDNLDSRNSKLINLSRGHYQTHHFQPHRDNCASHLGWGHGRATANCAVAGRQSETDTISLSATLTACMSLCQTQGLVRRKYGLFQPYSNLQMRGVFRYVCALRLYWSVDDGLARVLIFTVSIKHTSPP